MMKTTRLFDPTGVRAEAAAVRQSLTHLAGKVVGFIDNTKPNFRELAEALGALLVSGYGVSRILVHRKRNASIAATDEAIESFAARCDLVIAGSGD